MSELWICGCSSRSSRRTIDVSLRMAQIEFTLRIALMRDLEERTRQSSNATGDEFVRRFGNHLDAKSELQRLPGLTDGDSSSW